MLLLFIMVLQSQTRTHTRLLQFTPPTTTYKCNALVPSIFLPTICSSFYRPFNNLPLAWNPTFALVKKREKTHNTYQSPNPDYKTKAMSDLFTTFDSNSGHHDTPMASPSQHSPMTNNSNSSTQNGGTATTATSQSGGGGGGGSSGGNKGTNHSPATGAENTPVSNST